MGVDQFPKKSRVLLSQVPVILEKLGMGGLLAEIAMGRAGSHLFLEQLNNKEGILVENLVEFVLMEIRGATIFKMLQDNFGEVAVLEHFGAFYRLKLFK